MVLVLDGFHLYASKSFRIVGDIRCMIWTLASNKLPLMRGPEDVHQAAAQEGPPICLFRKLLSLLFSKMAETAYLVLYSPDKTKMIKCPGYLQPARTAQLKCNSPVYLKIVVKSR